jgi:hypothetical protein
MTAKERRKYRVDHGLCPICGGEAAPYYLCGRHRSIASIRRLMNKAAKRGLVTKSPDGSARLYGVPTEYRGKPELWKQRWEGFDWGTYLGDMDEDDKRRRPRINRQPVDLLPMLLQVFADADLPLSEEEIILAWGKLRSRRKTGSLAGDMTKLILAQRRRERRNAKRCGVAAAEGI